MISGLDRRRLAGGALQPVQPRRGRRARRPAPVSGDRPRPARRTTREAPREHPRRLRPLPAVRRPRRGDHQLLRGGPSASAGAWRSSRLTFAVRLLMLPLSLTGIRSMRRMQLVAPELKEVQEKYKDDRERQQREMLALYKEHGVNPLASCFPFLLQIPFFIAIYELLRGDAFKARRDRQRRRARLPVHQLDPREARGRRDGDPDRALHRHHGAHASSTRPRPRRPRPAPSATSSSPCRCSSRRSSPPSRPGSASTGSRPTSGASASRWSSSRSCRCRSLRRPRRRPPPKAPPPPPPRKKKKRR